MAGHHEVTITITCGDQTEGIKVDSDFVDILAPGAEPAFIVNSLRDAYKLTLFLKYLTLVPSATYSQGEAYINQHVTDVH